jgi:DNA-binding response OmpR family regulator
MENRQERKAEMRGQPLDGYRVLVVEDEFLIADELCMVLRDAGAEVIGPVGHMEAALAHAADAEPIDAAVLDLNLAGVAAYPVADMLARRAVPMVFSTGYDAIAIPARFANVATCIKPMPFAELVDILRMQIGRRAAPAQ